MNLYKVFTDEIDAFYAELKKKNVFYRRIFSGDIQVNEFAAYLRNVSFLITYTPVHLTLAERVAKERGYSMLASYFKAKMGEEKEHDKWGDDDVAALKKKFKVPEEAIGITSEMKEYIKGNEQLIQDDPYAYFVYVLFAEYFTVIAGPECMASVERHAKIPQNMMTIVGNHVELDKHHVHHWKDESVEVGIKPEDVIRHKAALRKVMDRYSRFVESLSKPYVKAAA
jgi:hypothetical protein